MTKSPIFSQNGRQSMEVYTPFIGGYWTQAIRTFVGLHLACYFSQILSRLFLEEDVVTGIFALRDGGDVGLWRLIASGFVHHEVPLELLVTVCILTFMAGDLQRRWGLLGFFGFYFLSNATAMTLRVLFEIYENGSMAASLAILWSVAFAHPERSIYGKISFKRFAWLATQAVFFGHCLFYLLHFDFLYFMVTGGSYSLAIVVAFVSIFMLPKIYRKLAVWKLMYEIRRLYRLESLKQDVDLILDKIGKQGMTDLSFKEHAMLLHASQILKDFHKDIYKKNVLEKST